jgi:uncharacterized OB-fold protein
MIAEVRPNRTLGPIHDDFWAACEAGRLQMQKCRACDRLQWPPEEQCGVCLSTHLGWSVVTGLGTVVSGCVFHQSYYPAVLPVPWETILVELDEGPVFISNPVGFSIGDGCVGARVEVCFLKCIDDAGEFSLPAFQLSK